MKKELDFLLYNTPLQNIYEDMELEQVATISKMEIVQQAYKGAISKRQKR